MENDNHSNGDVELNICKKKKKKPAQERYLGCEYRRTSTIMGWLERDSKKDSEDTAREIREKPLRNCTINPFNKREQ